MLHETKRKLLLSAIDNIKTQKANENQRSYQYTCHARSEYLQQELQNRNLQNNKRLLELLKFDEEKIYQQHISILKVLDQRAILEKQNLESMNKNELENWHARGPYGFEKYLERAFDTAIYEAAIKAQSVAIIDELIKVMQSEKL